MSELHANKTEGEATLQAIAEKFRATPLATAETYSFFEAHTDKSIIKRTAQRELFLAGDISNPELNFPMLEDPEQISKLEHEQELILDLMRDSLAVAHDPDREAVLYDLLRIRRLEVGILLIFVELSQDRDNFVKHSVLTETFNRANDEIHGEIEPALFNGLLKKNQDRAKEIINNQEAPEVIKDKARIFLENTAVIDNSDEVTPPITVDEERFLKLKMFLEHKFADLLELVPEKPEGEKYTAEEVAEIFKKAHELRETGWSVRLQPGKSAIDTRQNEETTVVGTARERTSSNTQGILVHENGVHVQRRVNGDNLNDPLLAGLGLPWYVASEEGITTIFQQAIEGKISISGEQYYLAAGLSRGLDGYPRDFRAVYELELCRLAMAEYSDGKYADIVIDKLKSKAYATTLRVRRGTIASERGLAYTKDIAYYSGNQKMWSLILDMVDLPNDERDHTFNMLLAAKFDPTNPVHTRIVERSMLAAI